MIIALGATAALAFMFLVFLRPGGPAAPSDAPLSQAALEAKAAATGQPAPAVAAAQGAVATVEASAAQNEAAANAVGATPAAAPSPSTAVVAPSTAAAPEPEPAEATTQSSDPSGPLLAALGQGKVLVVLFAGDASDDRAVARAVRKVKSKNVATHVASIDRVGDYEAITAGVQVLTAPTVLVIGADKQARTITGFTDDREISQLVGDVRGR